MVFVRFLKKTVNFTRSSAFAQKAKFYALKMLKIKISRILKLPSWQHCMNGKRRTLRCPPFLCRLRRRECWGPSSQSTVPLHELPPARLVIHRQTSAHERRKWTRSVLSRSGILAYLCTRQRTLAVDNSRAPHFRRAPRGGCCSGVRSLRSCMPSFGLGTTKP